MREITELKNIEDSRKFAFFHFLSILGKWCMSNNFCIKSIFFLFQEGILFIEEQFLKNKQFY